MTAKALREFLDQCEAHGLGPRGKIVYAADSEGHPCLVAELPERSAETLERQRRPKTPTKAQEAVRGQLETRRAAVRGGGTVPGHVPPVAKNGRVLKTRKKRTK